MDSVKDLYFQAEEKYYHVLDAIDEKVPIYKIIDPIDSVVPSFALLLVIGAVILALILGMIGSALFAPAVSTLRVTVFGADNSPIEGVAVKFIVFGEEKKSQNTDARGNAFLEGLARDTEVVVEASKDGYLAKSSTQTITELPEQVLQITLETQSGGVVSKTIRLVDSTSASISGSFTLSFRCSSPYATPPPDIDLSPSDRGVVRVNVPTNCKNLLVSVTDNTDFETVNSFEVFPEQFDVKIELSETVHTKGTISVVLRSEGLLVSESVEVKLFRYDDLLSNPEVGPIDSSYSSGGRTQFDVSPGNFVVKSTATDSLSNASSGKISIQAGESEDVTLDLAKTIAGAIKIKVVDEDSGTLVDDAKVTLKYQGDDTVVAEKTTDSDDDSTVVFNISKDTAYRAVVEAENYQLEKRESLRISDAVVTIGLSKCTPQTCGELNVKVLDQDGEPVENATVALYNADTKFLAGYSNRTTDLNGEAKFLAVASGNYFAFSFKESVSGRSDEAFFGASAQEKEAPDLSVTMLIPTGTIRAIINDKDGKAIPFPQVQVFDARRNEILGSALGDANGVYNFESKADKRIYFRIKKKDAAPKFADYVTVPMPVLPSTVMPVYVTLEPEIIDKGIAIEFLGLYFTDGKIATVLSKGEEYTAKFKLRVPEEKDYREAGVHIRTGKELIMEKDPLLIKGANAAGTSQIKATMFDESTGLAENQFNFTNDDSKWVNLYWANPQAGIYEAEVTVKVKETASISDELKLFWRTWAQDGTRERDPKDDTVLQEIYSETYSKIYQIGLVTLCDEDFCFSAKIRDKENGLTDSITDNYNARTFAEYELQFTILNNSSFRVHDKANLRIKNDDETLLFTNYFVTDAQTKKTSGALNKFEFPRFDAGTLNPKNKVDFTTTFITQKAQAGVMNIRLVSDEQIVFEKNLHIIVGAANQFDVSVQPSIFPSGIENDINVLVKDSKSTLEIEGAIVKLKDKHGNAILLATTAKSGYALLTLPAQLPGAILYLFVEKPEYQTKKIELPIKSDIVQINPSQLGFGLNTKTTQGAQQKFNATNLTAFPLRLARIELNGGFANLIDRKATQDALDISYNGFVIKENKTNEFAVKIALSEEGKALTKRTDIDARLDLEFSNFGKNWAFSIPVKITIDLEGAVDSPSCLIISRNKWETATQGDPVKTEVTIQNNCTVGGKPIELAKLQARIDLESNTLGLFDIAIGDNKTEIRSGYDKMLLTRIAPEQSITAILTFTPFGGVNGDAVGKISISAQNPQETDSQVLEQKIDTKITVVNLLNCLSIDPALISMANAKDAEQSAEFSIKTGAGNISCGGPIDFSLKSDLDLSPKEGSIQDGAEQKIKVLRGDAIQGQYPVFVTAKFGSEQKEQLVGTIRVRITEAGCIQLSRYEFDVFDDPNPGKEFDGFDTATITNKCFDKPVPARVNMRSFTDAMKFGSTIGLLTFGVSILGKGLGSMFGTNTSMPNPAYLTTDQLGSKYPGGIVQVTGADGQPYWKTITNDPKDAKYYRKELGIGTYKYYPVDGDPTKPATPPPNGTPSNSSSSGSSGASSGGTAKPAGEENPFAYGTATGLASLLDPNFTPTGLQVASNPQQGGGILGGFGGGGGGGIWGMGSNLIDGILGKSDPVTQGLQAFLIASIFDYYSQENKATFITIQRDVELVGVEIQKPGQEESRSNAMTDMLKNRLAQKHILKNVPTGLQQFLPYFSGTSSFFNIFTQGDEDIEVNQELRPTIKAMPIDGMDPSLLSGLFGNRADSTLPAALLSANPDASNQKMERRGIILKNKNAFITKKDEPLYKIMRVVAIRHQYKDKEYSRDDFDVENERGWFDFDLEDPVIDPTSGSLDELPPQPVDELFHLEFNAVPPEVAGTGDNPPLLNCQDGVRVGATGPDALPKVSFDWSWRAISENQCDVDNARGTYCDATQFSISLLKKIGAITDYVQSTGPSLKCPSPLDSYSNVSEIPDNDIGISKASVTKTGKNAVVKVTVANKNPAEISAKVRVDLKSAATGQIVQGSDCPQQDATVLSEQEVSCTYAGLADGSYVAEANLVDPQVSCAGCQNNSNSDFLNINFTMGATGLEQCEPVTTSRLGQFVSVSGVSAESILSKIKFRAYLTEDRYSADFQKDFDDFAKTQSFFDAPQSYNDPEKGLGTYFRDPKLFGFSSVFDEPNPEGYKLPDAGIYNVTIDITYKDKSWALFDSKGNPNAKMVVQLEKADTPHPGSPFYKLPFNGRIGESGRVNYGLNYRGDNILVNNDPVALVRTIEISGSSPVADLTVKTDDSFKTINTDDRGLVLRLVGGANPAMTFAPSFATPVILKMTNKFDEGYAFYSVEVDGGAANTGPFLSRWNGIGINCKSFDDRRMPEFFFSPDTHGLNEFRQCAILPGQLEQTSYGFEFCEPKQFGNMYLKTAFYTPQGHQSILKLSVAQESASFITPTSSGTTVPLANTVLGREIHSVEDIFDLVKSEFVCVSNEESKTEFWWNPKKVFELIDQKEQGLLNSCIQAFGPNAPSGPTRP